MEFGQQLASGKRNLAKRSAEIQEISKVLPKYADFLTSNVGIFDSQSFNQHSEAWKKPQPVTKKSKDNVTPKASKKQSTNKKTKNTSKKEVSKEEQLKYIFCKRKSVKSRER